MSRFIAAAFLLVATAAFAAANQVAVPVMTGTINGATYRTTVDIRSGSSTGCTFELRRSDGATFRSTDHVDAGTPKLFKAFASEFQPLATIVRVSCTDAAEVYSRIHESADGGITFNDGPLYRAADVPALTAGQTFSTPITGDFIVAEVSGAPVRVIAKLTATDSGRVLDRVYELAPFAQHSIGIAAALRTLGPVRGTFIVQGEGNVIVLRAEAETSTTANVASRAPAEVRSRLDAQVADAANPAVRTPPVPRQLLVSPIKAAPFQEPATGLVLMPERWYDPSTGTFLSPDPLGYEDSSDLYAFTSDDPVNGRDPLGLQVRSDSKDLPRNFSVPAVPVRNDDIGAARRRLQIQCGASAIGDRAKGAVVGIVPGVPTASTGLRFTEYGKRILSAARSEGATAAVGAAWRAYTGELQALPVVRWYGEAKAASDADAAGDDCGETYHRTGLAVDAASDAALLIGLGDAIATPRPQIKNVRAISADDANQPFLNRGWLAPYGVSTRPRTFTTVTEMTFKRVSGPNNVEGAFLVRAEEIIGLTPKQIQNALGLSYTPTIVSDVVVPAGTKMQAGRAGSQPQWGAEGGAVQYQLLEEIPSSSFTKTKKMNR